MFEMIKNLDFEKLRAQILEKGKPLLIAGVCFVAVFVAGYGTGKTSGGGSNTAAAKRSLTNYTTNTNTQTKKAATTPTTNTNTKTPATPVDPNNCYIKGSKSKIYHMPGGSFYERTNPAACFNSEAEAQSAGYTKSSR
jgi:hypothetical protein